MLSPQSPWTLTDFKSYWPFLRKYQTSRQTFADLSRLVYCMEHGLKFEWSKAWKPTAPRIGRSRPWTSRCDASNTNWCSTLLSVTEFTRKPCNTDRSTRTRPRRPRFGKELAAAGTWRSQHDDEHDGPHTHNPIPPEQEVPPARRRSIAPIRPAYWQRAVVLTWWLSLEQTRQVLYRDCIDRICEDQKHIARRVVEEIVGRSLPAGCEDGVNRSPTARPARSPTKWYRALVVLSQRA